MSFILLLFWGVSNDGITIPGIVQWIAKPLNFASLPSQETICCGVPGAIIMKMARNERCMSLSTWSLQET